MTAKQWDGHPRRPHAHMDAPSYLSLLSAETRQRLMDFNLRRKRALTDTPAAAPGESATKRRHSLKLRKLSFYAGPSFTAEQVGHEGTCFSIKCQGRHRGSVIANHEGRGWQAVTMDDERLPEVGQFDSIRQAGIALLQHAGVIK